MDFLKLDPTLLNKLTIILLEAQTPNSILKKNLFKHIGSTFDEKTKQNV